VHGRDEPSVLSLSSLPPNDDARENRDQKEKHAIATQCPRPTETKTYSHFV